MKIITLSLLLSLTSVVSAATEDPKGAAEQTLQNVGKKIDEAREKAEKSEFTHRLRSAVNELQIGFGKAWNELTGKPNAHESTESR